MKRVCVSERLLGQDISIGDKTACLIYGGTSSSLVLGTVEEIKTKVLFVDLDGMGRVRKFKPDKIIVINKLTE